MKLLILHDLPSPAILRRALANQTLFYPKYRKDVEVTLHGVGEPLDEDVTRGEFDVIFLDVSFLCWRWARTHITFEAFLEKYRWVAGSGAAKLAFPQDDYDHHQVLDQWLSDWNVDVVFTPLAAHKQALYPITHNQALIEPFQTGFIDDSDIQQSERFRIPLSERSLDVVYRARLLPATFGRLGRLKSAVAEVFAPKLQKAGFKTDISTDPAATIFGDRWLDFLGDSRFVLGSPSGSSVLDPTGEIGRRVHQYMADHPDADFEVVHRECVPESATQHWMAAISPRVLEAALTRTCQVLVRGEYGPLEADKHYIPIEPDFGNLAEVMERMRDLSEAQRIVDRCHELVTTSQSLHYRHMADRVDAVLDEIYAARGRAALRQGNGLEPGHNMDSQMAARLREKHRILAGMAKDLGEVTGSPIEIARFSELTYVIDDRWQRLQKNFDDVSKLYQELYSKFDVFVRESEEMRQSYLSMEQNYSALSAEYENLYTRPKALVARLVHLSKGLLLSRMRRKV